MELRRATLEERRKTYEWSLSIVSQDTASGWPDGPKHRYADFTADFEDFFYMENGKKKGGVMIIEDGGEEIGCVCYTCFHLKKDAAELDIWLKDETYCGRGLGTRAILLLVEYLKADLQIKRFIIRPKAENIRAIRAYEKAGFHRVSDKTAAINDYLRPECIEVPYEGEGEQTSELLVL